MGNDPEVLAYDWMKSGCRSLWSSARLGHSRFELSAREKPKLKHSQTRWKPPLSLHSQGPITPKIEAQSQRRPQDEALPLMGFAPNLPAIFVVQNSAK
jgi:hypothetical protein